MNLRTAHLDHAGNSVHLLEVVISESWSPVPVPFIDLYQQITAQNAALDTYIGRPLQRLSALTKTVPAKLERLSALTEPLVRAQEKPEWMALAYGTNRDIGLVSDEN